MPGPDLHALIADAANADPAARERAYGELLRLVTIFVRVRMGDRLRDHRESADVCQSIAKSFVDDAAKGALRFDSPAALNAYLQQVVRSKLAELARHDQAVKRGGPEGRDAALDPDLAPGEGPTASVLALTDEGMDRLLASLTPDEAQLVSLRPPRLDAAALAARVSPAMLSFMRESRRLANERLKRELRVRLRYPTVDHTLAEAFGSVVN